MGSKLDPPDPARKPDTNEVFATATVPRVAPDFTLVDQSGAPFTLSEHLDAGALLIFLRGDW